MGKDKKGHEGKQASKIINANTYNEKMYGDINNNFGNQGPDQTPYKLRPEFPDAVSEKQLQDLADLLSCFLQSSEAEGLGEDEREKIEEELELVKNPADNSRWQRIRNYLSDSANLVTVLTPLASYIAANSGRISEWISKLFT